MRNPALQLAEFTAEFIIKSKLCLDLEDVCMLTPDKHSSAAGCFPCAVFCQAGVCASIFGQRLLHHKSHLPAIEGRFPKTSHFTCPLEQTNKLETLSSTSVMCMKEQWRESTWERKGCQGCRIQEKINSWTLLWICHYTMLAAWPTIV